MSGLIEYLENRIATCQEDCRTSEDSRLIAEKFDEQYQLRCWIAELELYEDAAVE